MGWLYQTDFRYTAGDSSSMRSFMQPLQSSQLKRLLYDYWQINGSISLTSELQLSRRSILGILVQQIFLEGLCHKNSYFHIPIRKHLLENRSEIR